MNVLKSRRGGAYIMVLTATMLVFILVGMALTISTVSRRITARYTYFMGLYDLAVSGNEKALFLLHEEWESYKDAVTMQALNRMIQENAFSLEYADGVIRLNPAVHERFRQIFIQEAMVILNGALKDAFYTRTLRCFNESIDQDWSIFTWSLEVEIETEDLVTIDIYRVITALRPNDANDRFIIRTDTRKYVNNVPGFPTQVEASFILHPSGSKGIAVDEHTINNFVASGAIFYPMPPPGTILILDEFTLAMVESMRNDISGRSPSNWRYNPWVD